MIASFSSPSGDFVESMSLTSSTSIGRVPETVTAQNHVNDLALLSVDLRPLATRIDE